ncbi:3D domain-containing protein [Acetonema longum]|uniref:3D domain protein n=1 Tax=Acetonema longum DSM 6540 TaxID=1009370 RepID=F7NKD4_9FIRM|nr:3D domain-containing protein [Acetonema longum]EGO63575.1 3D domain protein [Acetonema longum DSM 6540]
MKVLTMVVMMLLAMQQMAIAIGKIPALEGMKNNSVAETRGYVMTVTATAYTPFEPGMTSGTGLAYDGRPAIPYKTVAVDPDVIPLGSRVWVPGIGFMLCHDTGNLIKGNIIDVCLETEEEMIQWGRKTLEILVIPPDKPYLMNW